MLTQPEPDPFRRSLFLMWIILSWLAAIIALVLPFLFLSDLIVFFVLFFLVFLPVCAYAVNQSKRWLVPDEVEYWKQQELRYKAAKWLENEAQGPHPVQANDVGQKDQQPSEESIKERRNAADRSPPGRG
jgi:hypothetical protein